jgi:hypothetical protein
MKFRIIRFYCNEVSTQAVLLTGEAIQNCYTRILHNDGV